jgi:hypothetical protein
MKIREYLKILAIHHKIGGEPSGWTMACRGAILLALGLLPLPRASTFAADTLVYSDDFDSPPGSPFPRWSSSRIEASSKPFTFPTHSGSYDPPVVTNVESPAGKRRFLGEFGGPRLDPTARTRVRQAVELTLQDLPPHQRAKVSFDLLILKSWDGSSPQYGPDRWSLKVKGGPTLLETTFSNNPKLDSDRSFQDYPAPNSRPQSGAVAVQKLGYRFFGDSTYHLEFSFPHAAGTLTLEFAGDLFEGKGTADESWGLDDVRVSVGATGGDKATGRRDPMTPDDFRSIRRPGP